MKLTDLIFLAVSNLFGSKVRSLMTVLGVGIGIGAIVFLVGLGFGLQRLTVARLTTSATVTNLEVYSGNPDVLKIDQSVVDRIKDLSGVEKITAISNLPGQTTFKDITTESMVRVIDNNYYSLSSYKFLSGKAPELSSEAVVSNSLLKLYNLNEADNIIGKELKITVFPASVDQTVTTINPELVVTVSGVFESAAQLIEVKNDNASALLATEFSRLKVKVLNVSVVPSVQESITQLGFNVSSLLDKIGEIDRVFRIIQYVLAGFGLIALIVASIGMFNTMTVTLLERTREIGVMRALGARRADVRRLFILEAGFIGFLGGIVGILLAYLGVFGVNFGVNVLTNNAGQEAIVIYYLPIYFLLGVLMFSLLIGLLTGVYPSIRASRLNPLDALRYE